MAETTVTVASMDISMGLDTKPTDHHPSEKQGSFTIEAASPCEDVDMTTPSAVSLNHSPKVTTLKGAKNNIMIGATPLPHPLSMSTESNSLHHFQTNAASPMYTTPTSNSAYVHAALGPLLTDSATTVPSSATAAFMALHGHTIGVYESPRRNSVPTLTADQVEHKRKVSSEEKTLHRQASWSNFSSVSTPLSSFPTTTSLPNLHQINTAHVDPSMMQYYRTQFSQQQALHHNSPHHSLNQALPPSANSSACPSPMPESFMHGSVLNSINSSPVAGAGSKKFGRSVNHSTPLKSQSKRGAKAGGAAERRRRAASRPIEGRRGSGSGDDAIKKEVEDTDELQPVLSSQDPRDPEGLSSMAHHHHHIHGYSAMHRGHGDHDDDYSPTRSPGGTPLGQPSSMGEDEHFGLISHSGYSTFANNTLYSMNDPMEHLSSMVPRFDHIRLDLKSVAPSDIHKSSCAYEDESSGSGNPNGESPHASPMPHYEQFAFPSSISTHFMPMMNGGFSMDNSDIHHSQHSLHHPSSAGPDSASPSSYSSLPSADSSASSASSFHLHHHHGYHPDGYQFGANGLHSMNSDLHYPPASPMNEDGSMNPHHSHQHHSHHHHPHPLHPQSFHHSHPHHSDFYDSKAANPQMLHHPFPSLQHPSTSALPPHPLMSTSPFTAPGGLNEPLYSSTSSTSSSSSLAGSRGKKATTTPDIINSNGSNASTKSASSSSSSSTTSSTNGASSSNNANSGSSGGGSKHGGSGKHHTCSEMGCSKRFKRLEHLKRHIKTHTLERPFNCPYKTCTKKFSRSDNLSQHVKTHQRQLNKQQMKQRNQAQAQQQQQQAQQQTVHS